MSVPEEDHISRIETMWTMVRDAHGERPDDARARLIERYSPAVHRYLRAVLREPDAADDAFQEFALRVLRGAFANATPDKGRFRDYLKTAVLRLATDHRRRAARVERDGAGLSLDGAAAAHDPLAAGADEEFVRHWRDELLRQTWQRLRDYEAETGKRSYSVLRHRAEHPDGDSQELAEHLSSESGGSKTVTPENARKLLQRARDRFSDLLVEEVRLTLESDDPDRIERELIDLGLHAYCRAGVRRPPASSDERRG